jgi:hypothetical protein
MDPAVAKALWRGKLRINANNVNSFVSIRG